MNEVGHDNSIPSQVIDMLLSVGKRIVCMSFLWSGFGILIGANTGRIQSCDTLGLVAQVIAWMIMMGVMGGALGLLGSPIRFVVVAALLGGIIGLSADWSAGHSWPHAQANHCLLLGAIVGTTIGPWLKVYLFAAKGVCATYSRVALNPAAESDSV